jgi:hypothetical protein
VWKEYRKRVKPHGPEWKETFANVLKPFIENGSFPEDLSIGLRKFTGNPRASSYADNELVTLFRSYDPPDHANVTVLENLPEDLVFQLENGRSFKKIKKMRSRYLCKEQQSGRLYFIHGQARVFSEP